VMIQIGQDDVHLACYGAHPFLTANNIIWEEPQYSLAVG
jgi:hypothetical protein